LNLLSFTCLGQNSVAANESIADTSEADSENIGINNPPKQLKPIIKVTEVHKLGDSSSNKAGLGDIIVVKVQNLKYLLDQASCPDSVKALTGCTKQEIRLFIDGRMIKDIAPESGAPQEDKGELQYHIQRNPTNDEAWADILGAPKIGEGFTQRKAR
jgi:hypothetical protein